MNLSARGTVLVVVLWGVNYCQSDAKKLLSVRVNEGFELSGR